MNYHIVRAEQNDLPSAEFLEFLGQGVEIEGEFLDPVNYQDIGSAEADKKQDLPKKGKEGDDE